LERLRAYDDSVQGQAADSSRRELRVRRGRVASISTSRGVLLVQPVQITRADGRVIVSRVAITDGTAVGVGGTLAAALTALGETVVGSMPVGTADRPEDVERIEGDAARWYERMRQAMKQGNWSAFGAAFDSLGRVLGRPPQ
jgi:uncharacterized membrane protein (UPF0182 family)